MPLNLYIPVDTLRDRIATATATSTDDAEVEQFIEEASRAVDGDTHRFFYTETTSRIFDGTDQRTLLIANDLLSVSAFVTDSELDGTFDGETWTEGDAEDFVLRPDNTWPKTEVYANPWGDFGFADQPRYVKITGVWGFGDGVSASPWASSVITATVNTTTSETVTFSATGVIKGETILVGSEQMYAKTTAGATGECARGVNGTTAATHSTIAIAKAIYPPGIVRAASWLATMYWEQRAGEVYESERIGDYQYKRPIAVNAQRIWNRLIGNFVNKIAQ